MPKSIGHREDARAQLATASTPVIMMFLPNFPSIRLMGLVYQDRPSGSNFDEELVAGRRHLVLPHRGAAHREAVARGHVELPLVTATRWAAPRCGSTRWRRPATSSSS